jgi:hypothetical protein
MTAEYAPVDLAPYCNAGVRVLGDGNAPELGERTLRGIPFRIARDGERCFVTVGSAHDGPISIRIASAAHRLIFAHRLFEPRPADGTAADGPMGGVVARYVVHYADGQQHQIPIREHFEAANIPSLRKMFVATDDGPVFLSPRHAGRWLDHFARREEVHVSGARHFYLWDWVNPRADSAIEQIVLHASGRPYLLAALSLSHIDEDPFPRCEARIVRITLEDPTAAARGIGELAVVVDRGAATYPYPLPERLSVEKPPGWGEPARRQASPAYVRIQAAPSATVEIRDGTGTIDSFRWRDLEARGSLRAGRTSMELLDRGRTWGRVTVVDESTGRPIPCRIHIQSPDGVPYPPYGHHEQVNGYLHRLVGADVGGDVRLGRTTHAYIPGTCEGWLPDGEVVVDVARGFEYEPVRMRARISAEERDVVIRVRRWTDMNAKGWYSGDTHVHFQSIRQSHVEAQSEDLDVVNLLAFQSGHTFMNTEDISGRPDLSEDGSSIVFVSSENRSRDHIGLLGARRPVLPWSTSGPIVSELGGSLDETLAGWADATHDAGGIVVLCHYSTYAQHEALSLVATGRADALELYNQGPAGQAEWYRLLNAGYRLPVVGGTDKMNNEVPVGLYRTYARVEGRFTYDTWLDAIRAGRTFMSSGPILSLQVDDAEIGGTVRVARAGSEVRVRATAESIFPVNALQVVMGGVVVAQANDASGSRRLDIDERVRVDRDTWIAARCGGPGYATNALRHHIEPPPFAEKPIDFSKAIIAHTSPIYVATGQEWRAYDAEVCRYLLTAMEGALEHIRRRATIASAERTHYAHGEADHLAYLERPYIEARAMIMERMRERADG